MTFCGNGAAWGVACFARAADTPAFDAEEAALIAELAPAIGRGLSRGFLLEAAEPVAAPSGPGTFVLDPELRINAVN